MDHSLFACSVWALMVAHAAICGSYRWLSLLLASPHHISCSYVNYLLQACLSAPLRFPQLRKLPLWAEQTWLGESQFNVFSIKNRAGLWETKRKLKPPSSYSSPSGLTSVLHSLLYYLPLPINSIGEMRNGVCSQSITVPVFCSFLLILFLCSLQHTAVLPKQMGVFPIGCSSSSSVTAWVLSMWSFRTNLLPGSLADHCSCLKKTALVWALHGLELFSTACLLAACSVVSCTGCRVSTYSDVVLHGLQENNLLHHSLLCALHDLQGDLCSGTWKHPLPDFFSALAAANTFSLTSSLVLVSAELFLSRYFSLLCLIAAMQHFFTLS